ncbi:aldolase/citrate lyase family protein [Candidatus Paracaedibacter symbiosus]|uniref:aldolase/citrate lyase family protein n=1 Tax=Candidatus Paracaedibacter symbiosus TaxID=244582 RepID=UPI0005098041|nr:aldolase/citrate lyase family protein [Candidatus Paracaedibacter symbiosus]
MNLLERDMLQLLRRGRDLYGYTHIRAEFEAEGSRLEELPRLVEIGYKAGLDLIIKIGGCEGLTGLYHARSLGASTIIAPMIESTYALKKYAEACAKTFPAAEKHDTQFYFNIETAQAYAIHEDLIAESSKLGLTGAVFGRVDFSASMNLPRHAIETPIITSKILNVARACQIHNQELIVGGGISFDSIPVLQKIENIHLNRFETRKIAFNKSQLLQPTLIHGLTEAARFELLWLKNKQNYYAHIKNEDVARINLLERRILSLVA